MSAGATPPEIYTIGHSNVPEQQLIDLVRSFEIQVVVDIRSVPYSQYTPQFNREVLEHTLRAQGIEYRFAGEYLGGRPDNPAYYHSGTLPDGKTNYLEEVDYEAYARDAKYLKGIEALLHLASARRTVIICSEEDPRRCHRHHLITQITLLPLGVKVRHIRGDGSLSQAEPEARQASLF